MMPLKYLSFILILSLLAVACQPANPKPEQEDVPHFPFDGSRLNEIVDLLGQWPQIEELGYVFTDHRMFNGDMVVYDLDYVTGFPVQVYWIDHQQKKYVSEDFYPRYYLEILKELRIDPQPFAQLQKAMDATYVEGLISQKDRKLLFLDRPMGKYQGYVYTPKGRKGMGETFLLNGIEFRVVEQFDERWFGFVYP